jgi:type IV secretion system protein VirB10
MTAESDTPLAAAKAPAPELWSRAPRPAAIRLRRSAVRLVALGGAGLVAGALTWAFVVQPELRASAREVSAKGVRAQPVGDARAPEAILAQAASYDRLSVEDLPPPRWGAGRDEPEPPAEPSAPKTRPPPPARLLSPGKGRSFGEEARQSALFFPAEPARSAAPHPAHAQGPASIAAAAPPGYSPHRLTAPVSPFELKAGAFLPAVLRTAVETSRPGPVLAVVEADVHDTITGRTLLVPQGSRLVGRHDGESAWGDRRVFLRWERLILPNGKSLLLDGEAGVDAGGAVGVQGRSIRRLGALAAATLFGGAVSALGQAARSRDPRGGLLGDAGDAAAIEGSQLAGRLVDRELQVKPTIRLEPGARVGVLITRDLVLEAYLP